MLLCLGCLQKIYESDLLFDAIAYEELTTCSMFDASGDPSVSVLENSQFMHVARASNGDPKRPLMLVRSTADEPPPNVRMQGLFKIMRSRGGLKKYSSAAIVGEIRDLLESVPRDYVRKRLNSSDDKTEPVKFYSSRNLPATLLCCTDLEVQGRLGCGMGVTQKSNVVG